MSAETDWREAARGIPVWEGAAMLWRDLASEWDAEPRWREDRAEAVDPDGRVLYGDNNYAPADRAIPNLTDPDTRAAYDRRLALALGAPDNVEACGVNLYGAARVVPGVVPFIEVFGHVGGEDGYRWCEMVDGIDTADPVLARALAWPADKLRSA